jgi:AP-2 complex subunit alpha
VSRAACARRRLFACPLRRRVQAGAAYWACGPAGAQSSSVCCCRVEGNPANRAQFRVTVVAEVPELATAVHSLLVAQIRSVPATPA